MTLRLLIFVTAVSFSTAGNAQTLHLQPSAPRTIVTADASAPPVVRAGLLQSTLIELPAEEKVATVFGGDTVSWVFDAGHVASRYISIKPKVADSTTDLHIVSDHGNEYTIELHEISSDKANPAFDSKVYVTSSDAKAADNIAKEPVFVPAAEAAAKEAQLKKEAEEARKAAEADHKAVATAAETFNATYPGTLHFDYTWDQKKGAALGIQQIWRDDKFTYLRGHFQETPALYELKDGKGSLINYDFANGLYTIPKTVSQGYLSIGKQRVEFRQTTKAGANHVRDPITTPATVPQQPQATTPLNKKQPLLILLFIILLIFVVSSVVNAGKKAAPLRSQMTARPATANPQQVNSFETQQEQTAKKDQEEQQQRAATAALMAQIQGAEAPGPEAAGSPPMTPAQRAAIYGPGNPDAPQATSQMSEKQAQAKQTELAREKQRQDALNSDTVAVDFARPTAEVLPAQSQGTSIPPPSVGVDDHLGKSDSAAKADADETVTRKPEPRDAAISKYDFDTYDGRFYRVFEGSVFEGVVTNHIDGGLSGPILLMLTTDYYSHDHQQLLLPQGTRLIGNVQAVSTSQARKMVVSFHRAICPDGFSVDLDKFAGLDPLGTTGLATKVDNRYLQTFAVAAAIGGLGGLAQIGNNNILDPSAQIRNGISSQSSQEAEQILNHFLNRLPIITLKEGSRARVYIGRDILIPSYAEHRVEPTM